MSLDVVLTHELGHVDSKWFSGSTTGRILMVRRFASRVRSDRRTDYRCGLGTQRLTTCHCLICFFEEIAMRDLTVIICIVGLLTAPSRASEKSISLTVKASADPTRAFPSPKFYAASISNGSAVALVVQAVRMPGGYVGSGVFSPCTIEEWNTESKSWVPVRHTDLKQFGNPTITEQKLGPGSEQEVCRALLPKEGARIGACVRFRLSSEFGGRGQTFTFVSRPFIIGGDELVPSVAH
jgi:hypothetical protein